MVVITSQRRRDKRRELVDRGIRRCWIHLGDWRVAIGNRWARRGELRGGVEREFEVLALLQ
jgi:hypothetical protein